MFLMKKAELERTVSEEAQRLRNIESRLRQIDDQGAVSDYDVVVKTIAEQNFLSYRSAFSGFADAIGAVREVVDAAGRRIPASAREALVVVAHSDFDDEKLDLEIGYTVVEPIAKPIALPNRAELQHSQLPYVETMATLVREGPAYQAHLAYGALGVWMEANRREIAGPCREVFLKTPFEPPDVGDAVVEIQFPVRAAI
jgi:effector-binding domain-containing protein